jgi:hypothetical protein
VSETYCNSGGTCANDINTNATCATSNNCDASLYCNANLTCVARVAIGATCSDEVRADAGCAGVVESCSVITHRCEAGLPLVNGIFCENMPD